MTKIGNLVSSLEVGGKKIQNPDWWYTRHKLKKDAKMKELIAQHSKINCRCSYTVNKSHNGYGDISEREALLRSMNDSETAWWDKSTRKQHNIILFR